MNSATSIASSIILELKQEQERRDVWKNSIFAGADSLKLDYAGKIGERFIRDVCVAASVPHFYDEDKIDDTGHYDIEILGRKVEVKTARRSANGAYQHEGLRQGGSDHYVFTDFDPQDNSITLTILDTKQTDLSKKHPILGRKPHLRKGTTDVYKFDFGGATHRKAIQSGLAIKITQKTSVEEVASFLERKITRQ